METGCNSALTDASFVPAAILYNQAGSSVSVIANDRTIFSNSLPTDCLVTSCSLKAVGCVNALAAPESGYVAIDAGSPFGVTAVDTVAAGYSATICYECTVTSPAQVTTSFTKDNLIIS